MTDLRTAAQQALDDLRDLHANHNITYAGTIAALEAALAQEQAEPVLQTCNCRWDGEVQVQQCTLHEAHVEAIHEWAERAKVAERKLAQQAEPTPPDAAAGLVDDLCLLQLGWVSDAEGVLHRAAMGRVIARATEVRRLRKIEQLKAQLAQMEGNT